MGIGKVSINTKMCLFLCFCRNSMEKGPRARFKECSEEHWPGHPAGIRQWKSWYRQYSNPRNDRELLQGLGRWLLQLLGGRCLLSRAEFSVILRFFQMPRVKASPGFVARGATGCGWKTQKQAHYSISAHPAVSEKTWWRPRLFQLGKIRSARDNGKVS